MLSYCVAVIVMVFLSGLSPRRNWAVILFFHYLKLVIWIFGAVINPRTDAASVFRLKAVQVDRVWIGLTFFRSFNTATLRN